MNTVYPLLVCRLLIIPRNETGAHSHYAKEHRTRKAAYFTDLGSRYPVRSYSLTAGGVRALLLKRPRYSLGDKPTLRLNILENELTSS